jgi:hypothetical protein
MPIDMEAVRRRLAALNGNANRVQKWKPNPGTYKIRVLEWPDMDDGMPFKERWVYYLGENDRSIPPILAPRQFGKPDPVDEFIKKLYSTGNPEDRELAKKMSATMRCHAPIVVRGEEEKGVQVWVFGNSVYKRLMSFLDDSDSADFMSPTEGIDLKVTFTKKTAGNGRSFNEAQVDHTYKRIPLHSNAEMAEKLLKGIPSIDDLYARKSDKEIKEILERYLSGPQPENTSDGTHKGKKPDDELESLKAEVTKPKVEAKPKAKGDSAKPKSAIDEAFAELEDQLAVFEARH